MFSFFGAQEGEIFVLLKYVEPNGNSTDPVPWYIRQQLLYQSSSTNEKSLALRPSAAFKGKVVDEFMQRGGIASHWTNLHMLLVGSLTANWADYARFLDEGIWKLVSSLV